MGYQRLPRCGEVTGTGSQMPEQLLSHSLSSTGQGEKIRWKSSRAEMKTGKLIHQLPSRARQTRSGEN